MNILALCSYPPVAAATRFRLTQFIEPLNQHGIDLNISPFLDDTQFKALYKSGGLLKKVFGLISPVIGRLTDTVRIGRYDLILVQREAMNFGPGLFEWLYMKIGRVPMVLDLDDATYVSYTSPTYGKLGSFFKFFGKTDKLIERAAVVICGNRFIAEYVESKGTRAVVIPTVVDTEIFCPIEKNNDIPVIGWIGTHSTFPFLEKLFPVFQRLAANHDFILRIIGSGHSKVEIEGVNVDTLNWDLEREVADFQNLDIGLYPMFLSKSANADWINGKSGFKAIQYLAVGIPFVMSPVGICAEIGEPGITHFPAETDEDWYNPLLKLLADAELRDQMGKAGRRHSEQKFHLDKLADIFAETLRSAVTNEDPTDN